MTAEVPAELAAYVAEGSGHAAAQSEGRHDVETDHEAGE
jgi:hypothetical protein